MRKPVKSPAKPLGAAQPTTEQLIALRTEFSGKA